MRFAATLVPRKLASSTSPNDPSPILRTISSSSYSNSQSDAAARKRSSVLMLAMLPVKRPLPVTAPPGGGGASDDAVEPCFESAGLDDGWSGLS
eukprot:25049-Chlamydomonas_euryale.AAC.1